MNKPPIVAKCLNTAEEIGQFIRENPDRIKYLVENEDLPAWRRTPFGAWKTIDLELSEWLLEQSKKYRND
jgi:hypothetical protein